MFKKLLAMLALAGFFMVSSPAISQTTTSDGETHTGLKRTIKKTKGTIRKTSHKVRDSKVVSMPKTTYNKAKNRVKSDDETRDKQERK